MPLLPNLNSLGKLCGSSRSTGVMPDKPARRSSVKRMSIIEDGDLAEVLYLIPKQSMLRQLPNLNPNDYYLCERLMDVAIDPRLMAHAQDTHHPAEKPVIDCHKCGEPCKGEVLRVQSKHFHIKCFTCKVCGCDLAQGGFFMKNGDYLCTLDYQHLHGTRCNGCGDFVEGEVVTALGKTYHPTCFVCTICKRPFPAGDRVTFNGKDCLCQRCVQPMSPSPKDISSSSNCAGCGRDIKNGQALLALERQWHLGCFKCKACGKVLTGEYISKDDAPYCEKDFQIHFGVKCEACHQFITGKVLEAGDKHYHPSCARCSRCNQMFTEGEEMYLQGSTVWHPDCKNSSRAEEKQRLLPPSIMSINKTERQPTRSSSESISSRPGSSIPGSPGHTIYSPRTLSPSPSAEGYHDMRERMIHRSTSQGSISSPIYSRHNYTPTLPRSPQHFHRPELLSSPAVQRLPYLHTSSFSSSHNDSRPTSPFRHHFIPHNKASFFIGNELSSGRNSPLPLRPDSRPLTPTYAPNLKHFHLPDQGINIYRKPPIYKQHDAAVQIKSAEDIIKSAKFPAASAPSPEDTAKIETDHWPCPPSLAAIGHDTRRRSREEEEEEMQKRRQIQEEHLSKMQSGLGKLILKEEMEKEMTQERYSRSISAQRYDSPQTDSCKSDQKASMTSSLPGYGRNGLHRPQSTDFSQYNSYGDVCGGLKEFQVCNE
ncbi:actin-binding LIM protein 1-like isoform X23 [Acipenser ruthenus]|uniref:actin-binding LIM protein 1-like isoform X23 n=1 Tax=Acipenser ruthenus TaxID=7906 RepID=UPI00274108FD|nr:actin-binding LIM protein 1-like isoform X23 [Acipenser ruthenus]